MGQAAHESLGDELRTRGGGGYLTCAGGNNCETHTLLTPVLIKC